MKKRSKAVVIISEHPWVRLLLLIGTFVLMLVVGMAACEKAAKVDDVIDDKVVEELLSEGAERPTDVFDVIEVPGTQTPAGPIVIPTVDRQIDIGVMTGGRIRTAPTFETGTAKPYRLKHIDKWLGQLELCSLDSNASYEFLGTICSFPASDLRTCHHGTICESSLNTSNLLEDAIQWRDIGYLDPTMIKRVRDEIATAGAPPSMSLMYSSDDINDAVLSSDENRLFLIGKTSFPAWNAPSYGVGEYGFVAVLNKDLNLSQARVQATTRRRVPFPYYARSDFRAAAAFYMHVFKNGICAAGSVIESSDPGRRILVQCNKVSLVGGEMDLPMQYRQVGHSGSNRKAHADAIAHYKRNDDHYLVVGGSASVNNTARSSKGDILTTPYLVLLKYNPTSHIAKIADIRLEGSMHGGINDIAVVGDYAIAVGWYENINTQKIAAAFWIVDLSERTTLHRVHAEGTFGAKPSIAHTVQALELPTAGGQNKSFYIAIGGGEGKMIQQKMQVWQFIVDVGSSNQFTTRSTVKLSSSPQNGYVADLAVDADTLAVYALVKARVGNSSLMRIVTNNNVPRIDSTFAPGNDDRISIGCNGASRMNALTIFENGDILTAGECASNELKKRLGLIRVYELE